MKIEMMELLSDKIDDIDLLKNVIEALDNMSSDDRIKTFNELKKCSCNKFACNIVIDSGVLRERTVDEQIELMEELKKCGHKENAYLIATDKNVLNERTVEEQIKLMKEAYIEELKEKMKKATVTHGENMKVISSIAEFKTYLKGLKLYLKKETDLNPDTEVLRYAPVDMWNKLVMSSDKKKEN